MSHLNTSHSRHPVAVIGAGPVGLAAAAHLLEHGLEPLILEAGSASGATFRDVAHVRLFTPWRNNIDDAARRLLDAVGWSRPDLDALPTADDLFRDYLQPLASHPAIRSRLRLDTRVTAVTREEVDKVKTRGRDREPFALRLRNAQGGSEELLATAVLDASGTWGQPNPLGANGLPAVGEEGFADRIRYGMPDVTGRDRPDYEGRAVLVVGAGHSAAGNLLALANLAEEQPQTRVHWAVRGAAPRRLLEHTGEDRLPARGALGERMKALMDAGQLTLYTRFPIHAIHARNGRLSVVPTTASGKAPLEGIDRIIAATGARPDTGVTRELRIQLDPALECVPALAPLVDPNEHSCGTVVPHGHRELAHPEPGFFIVGAKSYGRAPTFLMQTGYEQVRSIAAALAGDFSAADRVASDRPGAGVCAPGGNAPDREAHACASSSGA